MAVAGAVWVAFMVALWFAVTWSGSVGCDNLHEETGLPTKYAVSTCYVKINGQWVPEKNWRPEGSR